MSERDTALTELIAEAVDRGATTVEEIHREIAELPLGVLERLGLFPQTTPDVRRIQDASIGAIYDAIREINHSVTRLAGDLLELGAEAGTGAEKRKSGTKRKLAKRSDAGRPAGSPKA